MGWCISDRENTEVMQHFLLSLKGRSPSTMVSVLMTDDGNFKQTLILLIIMYASPQTTLGGMLQLVYMEVN